MFSISYSFIKWLVPSVQRTGAWLIELRNWISFDISVRCVVPFTICRMMYFTEYWLKSVIYIIFLVNQEPNKLTLSNLWTWKWFLNKLKHQHQKKTTVYYHIQSLWLCSYTRSPMTFIMIKYWNHQSLQYDVYQMIKKRFTITLGF